MFPLTDHVVPSYFMRWRCRTGASVRPFLRRPPKPNPPIAANQPSSGSAYMTLPYSAFPLERTLERTQGCRVQIRRLGKLRTRKPTENRQPVIASDASRRRRRRSWASVAATGPRTGADVQRHLSRGEGRSRGAQSARRAAGRRSRAAGPDFGHTKEARNSGVERFKTLGPMRRTTMSCSSSSSMAAKPAPERPAPITREVNHPHIKVNYDAGNVLDYLDK